MRRASAAILGYPDNPRSRHGQVGIPELPVSYRDAVIDQQYWLI
jgi:hypothetical protein